VKINKRVCKKSVVGLAEKVKVAAAVDSCELSLHISALYKNGLPQSPLVKGIAI